MSDTAHSVHVKKHLQNVAWTCSRLVYIIAEPKVSTTASIKCVANRFTNVYVLGEGKHQDLSCTRLRHLQFCLPYASCMCVSCSIAELQ